MKHPSTGHETIKRRLSLFFVLGLCLILVLNTAFLATYMRSSALQNTVKYEMTVLDQLSENIDSMNSTAKALLLQLYNNRSVQQILSYDSLSDVELISLLSQLSDYYFSTPYMYDYYLINLSLERVCTRQGLFSFESFGDQDLLSLLEDTDGHDLPQYQAIVRPHALTAEGSVPTSYFTYFKFDNYRDVPPKAYLVMNISDSWIQEEINDVCAENEQVFLFDQDGGLILANDSGASTEAEGVAEVYQHVQEADGSYFEIELGGVSYTALYEKVNDGRWTMARLLPSARIYREANFMALTAGLISLLLLVICLSIYFLSKKKVLSPVDRLLTQLRDMQEAQGHTDPLFKDLLLTLLRDPAPLPDSAALPELLQRYHVSLRLDRGTVLCLCQIDRYVDFCDQYDHQTRAALQYAIFNVARDLLQPVCQLEYVIPEPGTLLLILYDFEAEEREIPELIRTPLEETQKVLLEQLGLSFSFAVSDVGTFSDFKVQYSQTQELLQRRFFTGVQSRLWPDDVEHPETREYQPLLPAIQQFSERLQLQDYPAARKLVKETLSDLRAYPVPVILQGVSRINNTLLDYLYTLRGTGRDTSLQNVRSDLLQVLSRAETYDEIQECYDALFDKLEKLSGESKETGTSYRRLVDEVKAYIEEQYADPNLSLQSLSDRFPFSPIYLGRVFRRIVGCSVADYINRVRLEQVARLLTTTELPVRDAALACGFDNPPYLYTLFKKQYGVTPGEYKKLHSHRPGDET